MSQSLRREAWIWLASALLLAPVVLLYFCHYARAAREGSHPTGFIQYDMPYYMANAREHFDEGQFSLVYSNPFSQDPDSPRVYFQPITLVLALVLYLAQLDPGTLFVVFGAIAGTAAIRIAIALFDELCGTGTKAKKLTLICFIWSGGFLAAAGAIWTTLTDEWSIGSLFRFDPAQGWWFLNFGRNLCFPTEALYHALSLGCVLLLCRKRYGAGIACLALLSVSHPFTGTQFLLIVMAWLALEKFFVRSRDVPSWALTATFGIALVHFSYYLILLPSYEEHATLMSQWTLDWSLKASNMIPAYGVVALLAAWRMRNPQSAAQTLTDASNRLLIVWFFVAFLLANHEFALTPRQPLHFTRGYIWIPLFLLGAPTLIAIFDRLTSLRRVGGLLTCLLLAVLLADNAVWFAARYRERGGVYITRDQQSLLHYLGGISDDLLVVCESNRVGYLTTVYTKHRAWHSHLYNTPHDDQRVQEIADFLKTNTVPREWEHREVAIVLCKLNDSFASIQRQESRLSWPPPCYENSTFHVVRPQLKSLNLAAQEQFFTAIGEAPIVRSSK